MTDALEDHEGTISIGRRTITNVRFADGIDGLAGEVQELITPAVSPRRSMRMNKELKQYLASSLCVQLSPTKDTNLREVGR